MSTFTRRDCMGLALAGLAGLPMVGHAADAPAAAGAAVTPVEVEGFKFEPTATVAGKPLLLNGATVSLILSVRTTVVALYLPHKQTTPEAALAEPGAKRLCFYSMREVSAKDLSNTFLDRLRQNAASEEIAANFIAIAQFGSAFSNRSKLVRGDFVVMDFNPATNLTEMTLNGQKVGDAMQGESFFRMLMKIWMGPKVRPATRRGLLGDSNAAAA
ncbi:MAG TPA: chalcone isomerase family protein [Ideonella sp.]|uniref:chalcone isomerase family protein n=1 Tax=Ideonella sp. TaxID=1929293 RepID=UPI002BA56AAA|nr:chalcone isomerase family protein [Ideonella sp.]HSI52037.1 chalcone isomerase family protein [Ideonella sp.]